jgi:hypothetical protein
MGEKSKSSGEIGEKITQELLKIIGWNNQIQNISIDCNNVNHKNDKGNPKQTHGDDLLYIYNNPFYDDTTFVCHISVKNKSDGYPKSEASVNSEFKKHIKELEEIVSCAKFDNKVDTFIDSFQPKKHIIHIGILVWLHNNEKELDRDIISTIAKSRPDLEEDITFFVVDGSRANFLLKVVKDLIANSKEGNYQFYYPKIGTAISLEENRKGSMLPIELIVSDIIPAIVTINDKNSFYLYSKAEFEEDVYTNLIAYALYFTAGLVNEINIGFPDYNVAQHKESAIRASLSFKDREEEIKAFSYVDSFLNLAD